MAQTSADGPGPRTPPDPTRWDLASAAAVLAATARAAGQEADRTATAQGAERAATAQAAGRVTVSPAELLDALALLRWTQTELANIEPTLIAAARAAGLSWQAIAPALGVASRQAAERRYLRSTSTPSDGHGATRDANVQAERDRRAGHRAVARWANDNTADLRRLAGQVTALTDLGAGAEDALHQLHDALGDPDAAALPALLAATHPHLPQHPDLASQIDAVTARTDQLRQRAPRRHGDTS